MDSQNTPPQLRKAKSLFHLPEEIIEEILSRLPVKSLLKFRCVSKSWLSLIKSDRFIKIHYQNSLKNPTLAHHRVAYDVKEGVIIVRNRSLPSLLNSRFEKGSSSSFSIFDPTYNLSKIGSLVGCCNGVSSSSYLSIFNPTNNLSKIGSLVGCCNGVSCLLSDWPFRSFSLWNPATRVYVEILPKLAHWDPKWGFGWDESTSAFKIFSIFAGRGQIYSSKTNSWKTISPGWTSLYSAIGVFLGGRLHWATRAVEVHDEYDIESFDLESEEFERIELPPFNANANGGYEYGRPHTLLGEIGGCLCALFNYKTSADVWVMKEYGVKDSWFKLLAFPIGQPSFPVLCPRLLLGKGPNGEMFVIFGDTFMVSSPKDGAFSRATNNIDFYEARVYVESLLSPQSNTT